MCAVSMLVGAPRNCSRFVCRYGFHEDVLDSVYVPLLLYCCTRIQYVALAIILSDSGERMHRDKIQPQRMHAACRIVTRVICCIQRKCERYCSLGQLVESLCAAHEGKPDSGTYHSKTGRYTRRNLYRSPGLLYCGECTSTRINRQPVIAITWHFILNKLVSNR